MAPQITHRAGFGGIGNASLYFRRRESHEAHAQAKSVYTTDRYEPSRDREGVFFPNCDREHRYKPSRDRKGAFFLLAAAPLPYRRGSEGIAKGSGRRGIDRSGFVGGGAVRSEPTISCTMCGCTDCNGNGVDDRCDVSCSNSGIYCTGFPPLAVSDVCNANQFPTCNISADCLAAAFETCTGGICDSSTVITDLDGNARVALSTADIGAYESTVFPNCGNATCDVGETACSCPADCSDTVETGPPGNTCADGVDNDCDGCTDINDSDCVRE